MLIVSILCYLIKSFWIETTCSSFVSVLVDVKKLRLHIPAIFCDLACLFLKSSFSKIHVIFKLSKDQKIFSMLVTLKVLSLNFHYKTEIWQGIFQGFWLKNWGFIYQKGSQKLFLLLTLQTKCREKWLPTFLRIGESLKFLSYFSILVKLWCMWNVMNNLAFLKSLHYLLNLPVTEAPIIPVENFCP